MLEQLVRRHTLWVGFLAVVVPLGTLLGLQYSWLADLQHKSAVAEKVYLQNYLEAVSSRVEYYYRHQAESALNIPGPLFTRPTPDKVGRYLAKRKPQGAKALFVVNLVHKRWGDVLVFDPRQDRFVETTDTGMLQAIFVAVAPWKTLAWKDATVTSHDLTVDERDRGNRMILNPISDDDSQIQGVVGMIVDRDHFRRLVLPKAIEKSVPAGLDAGPRGDILLTVRDETDRLVWGAGGEDHPASEASGTFGFIFSDWKLAIRGGNMTPEEWAQSNFLLNVSLSAVLALVVVGGVVLALRTASREIKLSRMKSEFVSNVSHELRTPLASIRVFGEFLRLGRARSPDKSREYGEFIETESRRLTGLINNILDFSKIESGAKTYRFESASLERVVDDAARTLDVALRHKGFRLRYTRSSEPLPSLELDPDAITQAVSNLVDNAVKYSKGPSDVGLRLVRRKGEARISVEDEGIGIDRDEQSKIFERFHRVSTGLVHNVKGSGLGLSIVSHIARAHGGSVTVASEPGRGSTFTIHLPLRRRSRPAEAAETPEPLGYAEET